MTPEGRDFERIFITGASGSGKTTLARAVAEVVGSAVHHLDEIARVGGGGGAPRSASEREAAVSRIVRSGRWVAEGVHLGWTEPLLREAEIIVWLDQVSWRKASGRIVRRFVSGALAEARRQKGYRKFTRFGDYARHLREVMAAIPESRRYQTRSANTEAESRLLTQERLAVHQQKVVHCRRPADVEAFLTRLRPTAR